MIYKQRKTAIPHPLASRISASIPNYFPILRLLPDFMNSSKKRGKEPHKEDIAVHELYRLKVKERISKGIITGRFCEDMFKKQSER